MTARVVVALALLFIAWKVVKIGTVVFILGAAICAWVAMTIVVGLLRILGLGPRRSVT